MYCKKCGKELENNAKFCKFCGTSVEGGRTLTKPDMKENLKGGLLWIAASFLVIVWEGIQPWIRVELPFITVTEIQWYKIFKTFREIKEILKMMSYQNESGAISKYSTACMIPLALWVIAGLSIIYIVYLLYIKERKVKVLEAAKRAAILSTIASGVSVAILLTIGISLSAEINGSIGLDIIRPTTANYIVLIVSFLNWKVLIPKYYKNNF